MPNAYNGVFGKKHYYIQYKHFFLLTQNILPSNKLGKFIYCGVLYAIVISLFNLWQVLKLIYLVLLYFNEYFDT